MKDIPVFTTENGVASLVLSQIPYRAEGYIHLQSSLNPTLFLKECSDFLRACGAERVYATGNDLPARLPVYTELVQMWIQAKALPDTDAVLLPVQEEDLDQWVQIYQQKARRIPLGAWMTAQRSREMLRTGNAYFIYRRGTLLGIGKVSGDTIRFLASVSPGAGADVVAALARAAEGPVLQLTVASTNEKAVRLYEKLGFLRTCEEQKWYHIY